jgi:hypothetical protein
MKRISVFTLGLCALAGAMAQTNVGISIGVNQPGVYGQINIGNSPPPTVINQRPIVITQSQHREPLYVYVPPEHQRHWERHCHEYNGCDRPVYFVRETWVKERYAQENRGRDGREGEHDRGHDHDRGHEKRDRRWREGD